MNKILKTKNFILRSEKFHGKHYDYSKSEYIRGKDKVIIICPYHGEFTQTPDNHMRGKSCPTCAESRRRMSRRISEEEILRRFKEVHGTRYLYGDSFKYVTSEIKVTITCKKHGDFDQLPSAHSKGHGCPMCAHEEHKGVYVDSRFKDDSECSKSLALCYLVKFRDKVSGEEFIKIGITKKSWKARFYGYTDYSKELLNAKILPLNKAFQLEQRFLKMYKKHQYFAPKDFAGRTECFKLRKPNET